MAKKYHDDDSLYSIIDNEKKKTEVSISYHIEVLRSTIFDREGEKTLKIFQIVQPFFCLFAQKMLFFNFFYRTEKFTSPLPQIHLVRRSFTSTRNFFISPLMNIEFFELRTTNSTSVTCEKNQFKWRSLDEKKLAILCLWKNWILILLVLPDAYTFPRITCYYRFYSSSMYKLKSITTLFDLPEKIDSVSR